MPKLVDDVFGEASADELEAIIVMAEATLEAKAPDAPAAMATKAAGKAAKPCCTCHFEPEHIV
jgi:hypothetical protein